VSRTAGKALSVLESSLLVAGLACLGWSGWVKAKEHSFQIEQRALFERMSSPALQAAEHAAASPAETSKLIGLPEMPRLKLSAMVVEGDDDETLNVAIGHLRDTPLPGEAGNSALAGHRDSFFRPLKGIRVGDEIQVTLPQRNLRYRVERTLIVGPKDLSVLKPSPKPTLTLITCYPFSYIGHAPKRFVVQASQID